MNAVIFILRSRSSVCVRLFDILGFSPDPVDSRCGDLPQPACSEPWRWPAITLMFWISLVPEQAGVQSSDRIGKNKQQTKQIWYFLIKHFL